MDYLFQRRSEENIREALNNFGNSHLSYYHLGFLVIVFIPSYFTLPRIVLK